jgi:iron uptake system EfeUOB component EfeO/EfeM
MIVSLKEKGYENFNGENNPKARLSKEDVKNIRHRIEINHENISEVYRDYKDKISFSAYEKVCYHNT